MTHHTIRAIMRDLKQYEGSAVSLYAIGDRNRILQAQESWTAYTRISSPSGWITEAIRSGIAIPTARSSRSM